MECYVYSHKQKEVYVIDIFTYFYVFISTID